MNNIWSKTGVGALAVGAVVALAPVGAQALTVGVYDFATDENVVINVGDADDESSASNVVSTSGLTVGESFVTFTLSFFTDDSGKSVLGLTGSGQAGSQGMFLDAFHEGFAAGQGSPTFVNFTSNPSAISGEVETAGYVSNDNKGALFFDDPGDLVGSGILASTSDSVNVTKPFNLNDPFAMTIFTNFDDNASMTFDSSLTAVVPLPAGGLLLITALGGMAILRRRRNKAA